MVKQKGFTLIEAMIVAIVIGVLAMFALPSYQNYVEKGRLSEGKVVLTEAAARMERCFSSRGSYAHADCDISMTSASGIYQVSRTAQTASTYTLTAQRVQLATTNKCGNLTLTNTGAKSSTSGDAASCWR